MTTELNALAPRDKAQILAQGLEGQPSGHYQPLHSRKVARGRRSR